jgi:hypothetical protein
MADIDHVYALLTAHPEMGHEVLLVVNVGIGGMPMVADDEHVNDLKIQAQQITNEINQPIRMVRFEIGEEVSTWTPEALDAEEE